MKFDVLPCCVVVSRLLVDRDGFDYRASDAAKLLVPRLSLADVVFDIQGLLEVVRQPGVLLLDLVWDECPLQTEIEGLRKVWTLRPTEDMTIDLFAARDTEEVRVVVELWRDLDFRTNESQELVQVTTTDRASFDLRRLEGCQMRGCIGIVDKPSDVRKVTWLRLESHSPLGVATSHREADTHDLAAPLVDPANLHEPARPVRLVRHDMRRPDILDLRFPGQHQEVEHLVDDADNLHVLAARLQLRVQTVESRL